jgi:hypothetical protein
MVLPMVVVITIIGCEKQKLDTNLSGNQYKIVNLLNSHDNFFSVKFNEKTLEGQTISNKFSADYVINENKIVISNFVSSDFEEKDLTSKNFLTLFCNSFDFQMANNKITISNGNIQMELYKVEDNDRALFYYYFADSIYLELDTEQIYLKTTNTITSKSELISLFQNVNTPIDTAKSHFYGNSGNIYFAASVSAVQYKELLENINTMENVEFSTPCFRTSVNAGVIYEAWTNQILISTEIDDFMPILNALSVPSFELEFNGNFWVLTLKNIKTGLEPLNWANVLNNLTSFAYADMNKVYLLDLSNF